MAADTEYFFRSDGNDGNSGLSDPNAWQNPYNKESELAQGTIFSFNRGDIWWMNSSIVVGNSGVNGNPWIFRAYGTGDMPMLSRGDRITGWSAQGTQNVWQATVTTAVLRVFMAGVDGGYGLARATSIGDLDSVERWYWTGNTLYVWNIGDPDDLDYVDVSYNAANTVIDINAQYWELQDIRLDCPGTDNVIECEGFDNWTLDGTVLTRSAKRRAGLTVSSCENWTMENGILDSYFGENEGDQADGDQLDISSGGADGMYMNFSRDFTIRDWTFRNLGHTNMNLRGSDAGWDSLIEGSVWEFPSGYDYHGRWLALATANRPNNMIIRWCLIDEVPTTSNIWKTSNVNTFWLYGNIFRDNRQEQEQSDRLDDIISIGTDNDASRDCQNITIMNNVFARNRGPVNLRGETSTYLDTVRIFNNIFWKNSPTTLPRVDQHAQLKMRGPWQNGNTANEVRNNAFWASNGQSGVIITTNIINSGGATYYSSTNPPNLNGVTWSGNKTVEPTFENEPNSNFRLVSADYAELGHGEGYDAGASVNDEDGNAIETVNGWTIGAYAEGSSSGATEIGFFPGYFSVHGRDFDVIHNDSGQAGGDSDFLTYTEVDPGNDITITSSRITFTNKLQQDQAFVYKTKGAGFFSGDFVHEFDFRITAGGGDVRIGLWGLYNVVENLLTQLRGTDTLLAVYYRGTSNKLFLYEITGGTNNVAQSTIWQFAFDTTYYARVIRNEGTARLFIYSDSARTILMPLADSTDELVLDLISPDAEFSILGPCWTIGFGTSGEAVSGYVENFRYGFSPPAPNAIDVEFLPGIFSVRHFDMGVSLESDSIFEEGERDVVQYAALDVRRCALTYGVDPCLATGTAGTECHNTLASCQDIDNYVGTDELKYWFCLPSDPRVIVSTAAAETDLFPALRTVQYTPTRIEAGRGLSARSTVSLSFQDIPHHDRRVDPYVANRTYDPYAQGTLFAKFVARNKYYDKTVLHVYRGFASSQETGAAVLGGVTSLDHRVYLIDKISRRGDVVTITGTDPLKNAGEYYYPDRTTGRLNSAVDSTRVDFLVIDGNGQEYSLGGYLTIGSEIIAYETRSGNTFSTLTRAIGGTTAGDHSAGDEVLQCQRINLALTLFIQELFIRAQIPTEYWSTGGGGFSVLYDTLELSQGPVGSYIANGFIPEPTKIEDLLDRVCEEFGMLIYWDDEVQKIRVKGIQPPRTQRKLLTDEGQLLADSVRVEDLPRLRVSECWVQYNPADATNLADDNFRNAVIVTTGTQRYQDPQIKIIKSQFITSEALALAVASRLIARYRDVPTKVTFELDPQVGETVKLAEEVLISTRHLQGFAGENLQFPGQIISKTFLGNRFRFEAITSQYFSTVRVPDQPTAPGGVYGAIAPDGTPDYTAATDQQRLDYGWIASNDGDMSNGDDPYLIL